MEERFHRQPLKRLEVSPEGSLDKPLLFNTDLRYNRALTVRQNENKRTCALPPRYARSEILGYTSRSVSSRGPRQFYIGPTNETMVDSAPTSPGVPLFHRVGNSRSMTNLLEKENYLNNGAAVGQVRSSMYSQGGTQHRHSSWYQNTVRSQNTREASLPTSFTEAGGKRMTMTAAMAAAGANDIVEHERISASRSQVGYVFEDAPLLAMPKSIHLAVVPFQFILRQYVEHKDPLVLQMLNYRLVRIMNCNAQKLNPHDQ